MELSLIVAIISAIVAIFSAILSIRGQLTIEREKAKIKERDDERKKRDQIELIIAKYREPLIQAAFDLQSRIYNIIRQEFLQIYYVNGNEREKLYSIENTLYLFSQYFAWTEIIRVEVQYLDLGEEKATQTMTNLLDQIRHLFANDSFEKLFLVFKGEQRAIGEQMIMSYGGDYQCVGFASFLAIDNKQFQEWLSILRNDLITLSVNPGKYSERLVKLHHALISLINFLDPKGLRIPNSKRFTINHSTDEKQILYPGQSIGHYRVTGGALGCSVRDKKTNVELILSTNSVLTCVNAAKIGDPIIYPPTFEGGKAGKDDSFYLERFKPIVFDSEKSNKFDAALARPRENVTVSTTIPGVGELRGYTFARLGLQVKMVGRISNYAESTIVAHHVFLKVNYGNDRIAYFEDQIVTTLMARPGDVGSILISHETNTNKAVGLLFANSGEHSFYNPIDKIIEELEVYFPGQKSPSPDVDRPVIDRKISIALEKLITENRSKKNFVGVGVGFRERGGKMTSEECLVVFVKIKMPISQLAQEDVIPANMNGINIDVSGSGPAKAV
ncbi:hypothetical protein HRM2_22560 [Desulforapulum autotrophicum HRM2]|uniref:Uncharacterized protein n=1 Tax=Desulforapulum autotrophicum (strain ATCC 43914 / DSM 3382 / VKM B-1955 / HRM2) TaxID=177437 RepID=C0QEK9_DESAH|nr:hypothetical protein [Desulforapulum autotrophicum]ACN15351.1 hypothetical protein HRM2_22560 [Desulforapulum autotrophicum HRM2]